MGSPWKTHYYTEDNFVNPNSIKVWFKSACRLGAAEVPTERSTFKRDKEITCERCLAVLKKKVSK